MGGHERPLPIPKSPGVQKEAGEVLVEMHRFPDPLAVCSTFLNLWLTSLFRYPRLVDYFPFQYVLLTGLFFLIEPVNGHAPVAVIWIDAFRKLH